MWGCQLLRFALVGIVGFTVDASVLTLLISVLGFHPYAARALSFTLAVFSTWLINRHWTFNMIQPIRPNVGTEYLRYMLVQVLGAVSNLWVFVFALGRDPSLIRHPVIPLAFGATVGLVINFVGARSWVYADRPSARQQEVESERGE